MEKKFTKMGDTLKKIRKSKKMTLDEFAAAIGIAKGTYFRYENGEREAPVSTLEKIARLANISIEETMGKQQTIIGDNNIQVVGQNNIVANNRAKNNFQELFNLIEEYATPKLLEEFKVKLLKIKEIHES